MRDTWLMAGYDLLPGLRTLNVPTLIIAGERDFFPPEIVTHVAEAIPNAALVTLKNCGHFASLVRRLLPARPAATTLTADTGHWTLDTGH